ncbi:putative tyrosine carboxypeptidase MATCAP2 isoform X2 [Apodemus sylvaticus]|uniref:putative tyrosine carboxypeptidase MATCAP2 isoform X2 n=1 Tax=Apodemus sylvaticus TaxID=10129 RepID=UPI0022449CFB|nr:putative tyrosine carboxypeptidase MATCAP2 isoform X2 [Apodemus sylvaticus]
MRPLEPHTDSALPTHHTDPALPTQTPQPLRTSSSHGSALCTLGVVVRFPSLPMSRVSVAGAPPAASVFGGAECGKKAGSSPSNGVAATSPWRVLSAEARWNRQSAFQPLCQSWSSTLRCRSCPIWSRATVREFSSVRPAGLGLGLGGTMLESFRVTEKLHWPEHELAKKFVLNAEEALIIDSKRSFSNLSSGVLKDTFTTGTSSYNVLLQSKEEKKHHSQKRFSSACSRQHKKPSKSPSSSHSKDPNRMTALVPVASAGSSLVLPPKPKSKVKRRNLTPLPRPKQQPQLCRSFERGEDLSGKKLCILTAIKPVNLEKEKLRFFKSDYTYNPQFEYANPSLPGVLAKHSTASDRFLKQSINIMELTLQKYGSYEKFEQATGGSLLSKTRIWSHVRKYMVKEGCLGEIVVHLTEDLLSRASMTVVNGCPTLTINVSTAREHWLEGMLRHEIGTHYFRGINNLQQPWNSWIGRKKHELKPNNPTEEGLASIHSVLFRKDPFLWRAALLYYTVYQASKMSFCELFRDIGKFVKDPNTRWDYCVRAKRGWTDTSEPGCFSKDQVYLDGILQILRFRESIDFHLLTALGKVSYEDVDRLKELAVTENMRVPHFLHDHSRYMEHLEKIMEVNELTDAELKDLI